MMQDAFYFRNRMLELQLNLQHSFMQILFGSLASDRIQLTRFVYQIHNMRSNRIALLVQLDQVAA